MRRALHNTVCRQEGGEDLRYDKEKNTVHISVREFVSTARRGISPTLPCDDEEPSFKKPSKAEAELLRGMTSREISLTVDGEIPLCIHGTAVGDGCVTLVCSTDGTPRREDKAQVRGEGFLLCYMLYKSSSEKYPPTLSVIYINERDGSTVSVEERPSARKLEDFFGRCLISVKLYARPQVDRVTERLPSMAGMRFPYEHIREGQREFIRTAYKALARGGRLYASAPTGTGKTVSVLYPALKALGDERYDKVFYLTPKTTTAKAAKECIELFATKGAVIRAITLSSKERCCERGLLCRDDRRLCEGSKCNKLPDAVLTLYDKGLAVIGGNEIGEVARKFGICPYELQLAYSELCDVVICDINYLFDPKVYIRRYFTEGGRFAFLVDEAHNLPDRAREMYSAELSTSELRDALLDGRIGEHSALFLEIAEGRDALDELLRPYLREELRERHDGVLAGAVDLSEPPAKLYEIVERMTLGAEVALHKLSADKNAERGTLSFVKDLYYKLKKVNDTLQLFDDHFKCFIFQEGDTLRFKLFCLDTGGVIADKLDKGYSAVFFSATLEPINYFKTLLGADGTSDELAVGSPFDPSQLSVSIVDNISTRHSERERTLGAICRTIAATMSARRGNYMIFSPSFEYCEALYNAFRAKYPRIHALCQTRGMTDAERRAFLDAFESDDKNYLVGFCVMGGIYSEGVDLVGDRLIGAVVVGIGMPSLSYEREAMSAYFEDRYEQGKQYAYIYPGMNRVFQAAGRVIRREEDRGVIVLVDDRFADPIYKKSIPSLWKGMRYIDDAKALKERIEGFWRRVDEEKKSKC